MWDSCFNADFSYMHGGTVRASPESRYRQWMTHKLASWIDQFGMSGCVGCGRCITWCPAAIDITEEAAALRAEPAARGRRRRPDRADHRAVPSASHPFFAGLDEQAIDADGRLRDERALRARASTSSGRASPPTASS